jgi:hypothetical protein
MTFRGRRHNVCGEDKATLGSVPSASQGPRQAAAPSFSATERHEERRTPTAGGFPASADYSPACMWAANGLCPYFQPCLAPEAKTPGPGGAEPFQHAFQ